MGCERSLYKRKALLVDVNGDGACTLGVDRIYIDYSFLLGDVTFVLAGSTPPAPSESETEARRDLGTPEATAPEGCDVLNKPWPDI